MSIILITLKRYLRLYVWPKVVTRKIALGITYFNIFSTVRPLWVRLLGGARPLVAGRSAELTCAAAGARPKPNISWWKGGTKLNSVKEKVSIDFF